MREVLLVSAPYEAFILEQDGPLTDRLFSEYSDLNLSSAPRVTHATTGEAALELLSQRRFDLVIPMLRVPDMDPFELGRRVKTQRPGKPVVLLAVDEVELRHLPGAIDPEAVDKVFLWNGDAKILLAIIKYVEDRENVAHDIRAADVQVILLVENSPRYYSSYFAMLYVQVMRQALSLSAEGLNDLHRAMRLRGRPKILLASTYEEAEDLCRRYHNNLLAVITDVSYPRDGKEDPRAGFRLVARLREESPLLPVLIQSGDDGAAEPARAAGAVFCNKRSPSLLAQVGSFLEDHLGFGDFVFLDPAREMREVARARDLHELERILPEVPAESLAHHAKQNQISIWLMARCEYDLARRLRPTRLEDFGSVELLRAYLLAELEAIRHETQAGIIADFSRDELHQQSLFCRMGTGSLGGKARGVAFLYSLLTLPENRGHFRDLRVSIPQTFVIGTEIFDRFLSTNGLRAMACADQDDTAVTRAFDEAELPDDLVDDLRFLLQDRRKPLAVRSSSLLEDSQFQPFAGIYSTLMLPNSNPDPEFRLRELCSAIKRVFASTFSHNAREYIASTLHRLEEEKMAVIIQDLVGRTHASRFYPDVSGVAESHNFYPVGGQRPEEGVVVAALGLGRLVMEGGRALRFSPHQPAAIPQLSDPVTAMRSTQNEFFALDVEAPTDLSYGQSGSVTRCDLKTAEVDGTLHAVGSVYSHEDQRLRDSLDAPGPRVVTFNNLLRWSGIPVAQTLARLLDLAAAGMAAPVEIEFALDLGADKRSPVLYVLQLRPLGGAAVAMPGESPPTSGEVLCVASDAMGAGVIRDLYDLVYVRPGPIDRAVAPQLAREVGELNRRLSGEGRPYVLIGQGRWGSREHSLGIPVQWSEISKARVIVEVFPSGLHVEPSQGTHFFQNITSRHIAYLTVREGRDANWIDWTWLLGQEAFSETSRVRHLRLSTPLHLEIGGSQRRGVLRR